MESCAIILFGATGDLAKKKLIPALYMLHTNGELHKNTKIILIGRRELSVEKLEPIFRKEIDSSVFRHGRWKEFTRRLHYHLLEFHDEQAYERLHAKLVKEPRRIFYLATPQGVFPTIIHLLERTGLAERDPRNGWHRVIFEKPFGSDFKSAKELNKRIGKLFHEKQIYRIDHYLGKSFVQEIFALRFANPVFEQLWSRKFIDNIQIVVSEKVGVETRGDYYDNSGAVRDMVQNHLLQLLCLIAMEPPQTKDQKEIRSKKVGVLKALKPRKTEIVIGQYKKGKHMRDYTSEKGVAKNSSTETYVAGKIQLSNRRWKGVPFYIRTGKALKHQYAQISIVFKQAACNLFHKRCPETNVLILRIQPEQGMKLRFNLLDKQDDSVAPQWMEFLHKAHGFNTPEAYELLLSDAIEGDQTLFTSWEFLERSWKFIDTLRARMDHPVPYTAGTHGPKEALDLLTKDGRDWIGNAEIIRNT